jgi:UPF0271 protein
MRVVDLNADVGESESPGPVDADLMRSVTSANVACGVHAGNAEVMGATVRLALRHGVAVGAHPSLDDRPHFGRRELPVTDEEVDLLIRTQVRTLAEIALRAGARLRHVKPHGALYNMAARDPRLATAIASAVAQVDPELALVGLSGSALIAAGRAAGLITVSEAFADRGYLADGSLAPRSAPDAVLHDPDTVAERAVAMVRTQHVIASDGAQVPLMIETLCIHSDTPGAPALAQRVRAALEAAGIVVSARR